MIPPVALPTSLNDSPSPHDFACSKKIWGRFDLDTSPTVLTWVDALPTDENFVEADLWGSMAHVIMLGTQGIISPAAASKILPTLKSFQDKHVRSRPFEFRNHDELQKNMEARLIEAVGADVGGRIHTARSRNDQIHLDSKLYTRKHLLDLRQTVLTIVKAFLDRAEKHTEDVMVGYAHTQHAQPISVAFWLTHYAAIFLRDLERLKRAYDITDTNPLGVGAVAGTSFPIDRNLTTKLLGFQKTHIHGLDVSSSRDFMLEVLSACANLHTTFSRLAEELITWSSFEFSTVSLSSEFLVMPQKKNHAALEVLRSRAARVIGLLSSGHTLLKGLPSGYSRDFSEEKEILVEALDLTNKAADVVPSIVEATRLNLKRMEELCHANFATATEVANHLVVKHDVPFRNAHHIVSSLIGDLFHAGKNFKDAEFCVNYIMNNHKIKAHPQDLLKAFDPKAVMMSCDSVGGTAPVAVKAMMKNMRKELESHTAVANADKQRVSQAHATVRSIAESAGCAKTVDDLKKLIPADYYASQ